MRCVARVNTARQCSVQRMDVDRRTNKCAQKKQDVGREHGRVHVSAIFINHDCNVRGDEKDAPGECEARHGVLQGANRTLQQKEVKR